MATLVSSLNLSKARTITTSYDNAGRVAQVVQPAAYSVDPEAADVAHRSMAVGATTVHSYDAFGAVIQTKSLVNSHTGKWSIVNQYYDQRGLLSASVDNAGYLTSYSYDSFSNATSKVESSEPITGWTGDRSVAAVTSSSDKDRITTVTFDKLNRTTRESLTDGTGREKNAHVQAREYDALGNVTLVKGWGPGASDSLAPTRMFYDALGRTTAVIDGTHVIGHGFGLTTYRHNMAGKVVSETQYANGSVSVTDPTPALASADDRVKTVEYDEQGNAIRIVTADGVSQYIAYNNRGLQTETWYVGKGIAYAAGSVFAQSSRSYDQVGRLLTDTGKGLVLYYNAFGDVTRKEQGTDVIKYDYDNAGRMWRSNEGGIDKIHLFDLLGRKSAEIRSGGYSFGNLDLQSASSAAVAAAYTQVMRTDYLYDAAGNVAQSMAPTRDGTRPVITQVFDRWKNLVSKTEPGSATSADPTTTFAYDVKNQLVSEQHAKADGSAGGRVRTLLYVYGAGGAVVMRQTIDRESAAVTSLADNDSQHARYRIVTEHYTAAGKLLSSSTNGLVTERHTYDAFDQLVTDELHKTGFARYTYDHMGRATSVTHGEVDVFGVAQSGLLLTLVGKGRQALTEYFKYDELGYLASHTNGAEEVTSFKHDVRGNLIWSDTLGSAPTSASYDVNGRKVSAIDAFGSSSTWVYDSNGRLDTVTGYDGLVTQYAYDKAGQLRSATQSGKGQVVTYTYDASGQNIGISDIATGINGYPAMNKQTTFGYDLAGNLVREITVQGGKTFADNTNGFDALHRLVSVSAADIGQGAQSIAYEYDGFGNRSRFTSQAWGKEVDRNQNGYFFYDALNRMTISAAIDAAGTAGAGTMTRIYDAAGNLQSSTAKGRTDVFAYDAMNRVISTTVNGTLAYTTSYDAAGRVVADGARNDDAPEFTTGMAVPVEPKAPDLPPLPADDSTPEVKAIYAAAKAQYDLDLVKYQDDYKAYQQLVQDYQEHGTYMDLLRGSVDTAHYQRQLKLYDAQGRLLMDQAFKSDNSIKTVMINQSFDEAGNVLAYMTDARVSDRIESYYTNTYRNLSAGRVMSTSTGYMKVMSGKMEGKTGAHATSTMVYDANGFMIGVDYSTAGEGPTSGTSNKMFVMDSAGRILLSREQSHNSPTAEQHQILAAGELQLRYSTSHGSFNDLTREQEDAFWKAYRDDAFQSLATPNGDLAVNPGAGATTGQVVIVQEGDTLQSIAARIYGTPDAWYRIADANNLEPGTVLIAGQTVVVPGATADNSALDFNSAKLIGSTAPNLPPPPPDKKNCITLIIVAVAVIVASVLIPVIGPLVNTMLAGTFAAGAAGLVTTALAAAAGNLASQVVGIAAGVQNGINWKNVGMAGVSAMFGGTGFISGAINNIALQGIKMLFNMQEDFSWTEVAAAGVGSMAGGAVKVPDFSGQIGTAAQAAFKGFAQGLAAGVASGLTADLLTPGKQNYKNIAREAVWNGLEAGVAAGSAVMANNLLDKLKVKPYEASRLDLGKKLKGYFNFPSDKEKVTAEVPQHEATVTVKPVEPTGATDGEPRPPKPETTKEHSSVSSRRAPTTSPISGQGPVRNDRSETEQVNAEERQQHEPRATPVSEAEQPAPHYRSLASTLGYATMTGIGPADSEGFREKPTKVTITYHFTWMERVDNFLHKAAKTVSEIAGMPDEMASEAGRSNSFRAGVAVSYLPRKLVSHAIEGLITLPRFMTSNDLAPSMVRALSNPRKLYNDFKQLPIQDQIVYVTEALLPLKPGIAGLAGKMPGVGKYLSGNLHYSRPHGIVLEVSGKYYAHIPGAPFKGALQSQRGAINIGRFGEIEFPVPGGAKAAIGEMPANPAQLANALPVSNNASTAAARVGESFRMRPIDSNLDLKVVTYGKNEAVYYVDKTTGLPIRAYAVLNGSNPGRVKGYVPEPVGGRAHGDHRGHLVPEGGVAKPSYVNHRYNVISEAPSSNLRLKKELDNAVSKLKDRNPTSEVAFVGEPVRRANATRPHAVSYYVTVDGLLAAAVTVFN